MLTECTQAIHLCRTAVALWQVKERRRTYVKELWNMTRKAGIVCSMLFFRIIHASSCAVLFVVLVEAAFEVGA